MATKSYKPTSAGRRFSTRVVRATSRNEPHKPLLDKKPRTGGRNSVGEITIWHRGGGHKRRYRVLDFLRRDKVGISARVETIEYDPNRTANIALLCYQDGERRYILAPAGLDVGRTLATGPDVDIVVGNALPLRNIPPGTLVHNLELKPGRGGQLVRAAGGAAQVMAREGDYALVRLPSGETRRVHADCFATVGQISNLEHESESVGKAGRNRWKGWRPTVRGVAMNPVDHPLGGGEGKSSGGRPSCTPWGVPCKGKKTRNNPRTNRWIVRRRR